MKIALSNANTLQFTQPGPARELAIAAEEAGVESVWTVEHVVWPTSYDSAYPYHRSGKMPGDPTTPIPDPVVWLTWMGAVTSKLRLATGVIILPQRNTHVLAKELATLDSLTEGRVELGVGVGWLEEEFTALQVPFERRGKRTDEMIEAMQVLWSDDDASYDGELISFSNVAINPKPANGRIPVTIGGSTRPAARRAAKLGDGYYPGPGSLEGLEEAIGFLNEECEKVGRDPNEIELSVMYPGRFFEDPAARIEALSAYGVDRIMVSTFELLRTGMDEGLSSISELT